MSKAGSSFAMTVGSGRMIRAGAVYLTGRMHRIFILQEGTIQTMAAYITWIRETFRDNSE